MRKRCRAAAAILHSAASIAQKTSPNAAEQATACCTAQFAAFPAADERRCEMYVSNWLDRVGMIAVNAALLAAIPLSVVSFLVHPL
jgi:hypothetical protein